MTVSDSDSFDNCVSARSSFSQQCSLSGSSPFPDTSVATLEGQQALEDPYVSADALPLSEEGHPGHSAPHSVPRHEFVKSTASGSVPDLNTDGPSSTIVDSGVIDIVCRYLPFP